MPVLAPRQEFLLHHCPGPEPVHLELPVLPVIPVDQECQECLQLHCPVPEHQERLVLQEPARPLVHWHYYPYPAQGCFDYIPPKQPSPRKR